MFESIDLTRSTASSSRYHIDGLGSHYSRETVAGRSSQYASTSSRSLSDYNHRGLILEPGSDVILRTKQCMRIKRIKRLENGEIVIQGWIFESTAKFAGYFNVDDSELCIALDVLEEDQGTNMKAPTVSVPVRDVVDCCLIIVTNLPSVQSFGPGCFICRWKIISYYRDYDSKTKGKPIEVVGEHLQFNDCDEGYGADSEHLLFAWTGGLIRGGSSPQYLPGESEHLRDEQRASRAGSASLSSGDFHAAKSHMAKTDPVSNIARDQSYSGDWDTDGDDIVEQWSRYVDQDDDDLEEMMLPPSTNDSFTRHPDKTTSRTIDLDGDASDSSECTLVADRTVSAHTAIKGTIATSSRRSTLANFRSPYVLDESEDDSSAIFVSRVTSRKRRLEVPGEAGPSRTHLSKGCDEDSSKRRKLQPVSRKQQRYTLGDAFCGAGGVSRGAVTAGLRPKWAFDFDIDTCNTYSQNFYKTGIHHYSANSFLRLDPDFLKVDILHLSPPCQYFSPAHTREGPDDELNVASLYAVSQALKRCRPRIVTIEETSGLQDQAKHGQYFRSLIGQLTDNGYSFRWRVIRCCDYGVPQRRRRLFIIAAW